MVFAFVGTMNVEPAYAAAKTPKQVKELKVKKVSASKIKLSWKKAANAKKYEVYRADYIEFKYKKIKTTSGTSLTLSPKKDVIYCYKVRGINGKKKGSFSKLLNVSLASFSADKIKVTQNGEVFTMTNNTGKDLLINSYAYCSVNGVNQLYMYEQLIDQCSGVTRISSSLGPSFNLAPGAVFKFRLIIAIDGKYHIINEVDEVEFMINKYYNSLFWCNGTTSWKPSVLPATSQTDI